MNFTFKLFQTSLICILRKLFKNYSNKSSLWHFSTRNWNHKVRGEMSRNAHSGASVVVINICLLVWRIWWNFVKYIIFTKCIKFISGASVEAINISLLVWQNFVKFVIFPNSSNPSVVQKFACLTKLAKFHQIRQFRQWYIGWGF